MNILETFRKIQPPKERSDFLKSFFKWASAPTQSFGGESISLKPKTKALFTDTCPKNSLWTEASTDEIAFKLNKLFYERAYANLEPLIMADMMHIPLPRCSK